jgi:hypothetical protein
MLAVDAVNKEVNIVVWRNEKKKTLRVSIAEMKEDKKVIAKKEEEKKCQITTKLFRCVIFLSNNFNNNNHELQRRQSSRGLPKPRRNIKQRASSVISFSYVFINSLNANFFMKN